MCSERLQLCLAISVSELSYVFSERLAYLIWTDSQVMEDEQVFGALTPKWMFPSCWHANVTPDHKRIQPGKNELRGRNPLSDALLSILVDSELLRHFNIIISMQRNEQTVALRHPRVREHGGFWLKTVPLHRNVSPAGKRAHLGYMITESLVL